MKKINILNSNKGFTIIETIVVISIIVLTIGFGFTKISDFFNRYYTLTNIEKISNTILKNKIESNFQESNNIIYFNKNFNLFYSIYNDSIGNKKSFYINSGTIDKYNLITINLNSDDILSSTGKIIIDTGRNIIGKDIYFSSSGTTTDNINIDFKDIYSTSIYIKDKDKFIISGNIKIIPNSYKNNLLLSNLIGINLSNKKDDFDIIKMINSKSGKYKYFGYIDNNIYRLKNIVISFIDDTNNNGYLEFN